MLGAPDSGQFTVGPSLALLQTSYNWYLQDDWKVSRTLTLNLGVRFEYQTPFKERYNHLAYFDPSATEPVTGLKGVLLPTTSSHRYPSDPNNNWAPRVGLAWTFLPNTVFRAGYGLFYAPGSGGIGSSPGDLGSGSSVATGIYFGQAPAAPNTPVPGASLANPFVTGLLPYPNSLVGNGIGAIFPNWTTPHEPDVERQHPAQRRPRTCSWKPPTSAAAANISGTTSRATRPSRSISPWARNSTTWCRTRSSARSPPAR